MVLLLHNHEIRGLMDLSEYIDAVESGYREFGRGAGVAFPRENLWIKGDRRDSQGGGHIPAGSKASFKFKAGLLPGLGGAGVNAYTAGLPGGLSTFMFLFDTDSGALAAILEVMYLSWLKTAAVSALATRYLAPPDSAVLALFGTGPPRPLAALRPDPGRGYSARPGIQPQLGQAPGLLRKDVG